MAEVNAEEAKVGSEQEAAANEPVAAQVSTPSVVKDIPMSKMQQDALSKVREDAEVQDERPNETPSLNPATSKVSASSQNDIEALYLKEMTKISDAPDTQLGPTDT